MTTARSGNSEPEPAWIRRRTTIADLLDDGIENGSDVAGLSAAAEELPVPGGEDALRKRDQTLAAIRAEQRAADATMARRSFSPYGVFLGVLIAAGGTWLIARPVDMRVLHDRAKHLPFREHVTPARSRLYGTAGLVGGLLVVAYAMRRPGNPC